VRVHFRQPCENNIPFRLLFISLRLEQEWMDFMVTPGCSREKFEFLAAFITPLRSNIKPARDALVNLFEGKSTISERKTVDQ
jgi:hypothetical protein